MYKVHWRGKINFEVGRRLGREVDFSATFKGQVGIEAVGSGSIFLL